jgi:hypothetical protein
MTPAVKYALGRFLVFVACALPVFLVLPAAVNPLLKLLIALLLSMVVSLFVLRRWRDELAAQLALRAQQRQADRERLRRALEGEDNADEQDRRASG